MVIRKFLNIELNIYVFIYLLFLLNLVIYNNSSKPETY